MRARLEVVRGAKTAHLDLHLPTIIGRGGESRVKLPSSTVSRQHCEVYDYQGQIAVRDLGSSNGTIVNGHRVSEPTFITPNDEVVVGPVAFRLHIVPSPEVSPEVQDARSADDDPGTSRAPATPEPDEGAAVHAESPDVCEEPPITECLSDDDEGSVLQYVKPTDDGDHSFVEIVTAADGDVSDDVPSESSALEIEGTVEAAESVANDDSQLQSFFKNLDG